MKEVYHIVRKVHLSEKASLLSEKLNQYVFRVSTDANKIEIKHAVETLFKKQVVSVRTMQYAGKIRRERRADFGRRAHWKKAIVSLAPGDKIDIA
ncbi:MAG: 50S ribosomal protein L23 [Verrucomicrobia bacterium RIFCSPHIGHO2_12_FULL_41_10]|nr:MAG: 50S ribosomal protein L23 [Verrucomicrobia bacterium RIFCSPHIGHO2_12_FULL_41_10]HLB32818.1 50S ribosomal protein L23 [Chthoniobacterales bacterium]